MESGGGLAKFVILSLDLRVQLRHQGSPACAHDPSRGEGALPHLRQAAVGRIHHRSHESAQPVAAPRLPPLQPQ